MYLGIEQIGANSELGCHIRIDARPTNSLSVCHLTGLDYATTNAINEIIGGLGCSSTMNESVESLFRQAELHRPGCVVAMLREEDDQTLHLPQRLVDHVSPLKVVFLAQPSHTRIVVKALRFGAEDIIVWPSESFHLNQAIQFAFAASIEEHHRVTRCLVARQKMMRLTANESEVLDLMLMGKANKNIATTLGIAGRTVELRRKTVFDKLETRVVSEIYAIVQDSKRVPSTQIQSNPRHTSSHFPQARPLGTTCDSDPNRWPSSP
jgi:two-component system response regulator FixJ